MIEYNTLKTEIIGKLEIDETDATRFDIDNGLAHAQRAILNALPIEFLSNAIKTVTFNLVNGTALYQFPTDYSRFVNLWVDFVNAISSSNLGKQTTLYKNRGSYLSSPAALATTRFPYVDLDVEGGMAIYPVPTVNVSSGARLRYIYQLPAPTSVQNCLLNENLMNLLVYKATELCALIEEFNLDLSKKMGELYMTELKLFLPKKDPGR